MFRCYKSLTILAFVSSVMLFESRCPLKACSDWLIKASSLVLGSTFHASTMQMGALISEANIICLDSETAFFKMFGIKIYKITLRVYPQLSLLLSNIVVWWNWGVSTSRRFSPYIWPLLQFESTRVPWSDKTLHQGKICFPVLPDRLYSILWHDPVPCLGQRCSKKWDCLSQRW